MPLPAKQADLAEIIRVNQAGEYGAKRIYQGQLATLRDPAARAQVQHMLEQELVHLDYFTVEMGKRGVRPTALQPLWHIGGFALGAITALMSKEAAMACTVAVESVIDGHYREQLATLTNEPELQEKIETFRAEEMEHHDLGLKEGAEQAAAYPLLSAVIKGITRGAIELSKKV